MAGKLVTLFHGAAPVWDIAGDGSQGYCQAVAVIAGGGGGGSGTLTSIAPVDATLTFTPNPITTTGTIGLNLSNANTWLSTQTFPSPVFTGTPVTPTAAPGTNTTQVASTAFVTAAVTAALTSVLTFKGTTDCSTNPNYPAAVKGDTYVVSVAGKIGGASGIAIDIGDMYIAIANNAGGTQAAVGASWDQIEHNLIGALLASNNLSDVANVATAVNNLGGATSTGTGGLVRITSPTLVTPILGVAAATSLALSGTAGAGFITYPAQSSAPSAPASGFSEYADSTGRKSWIRASDGFTRTWDATVTANRVYTLPDATGTIQLSTLAGTHTVSDGATVTATTALTLGHNTSATAGISFGTKILFNGQDDTSPDQNMAAIQAAWTTATHASRTSQLLLQNVVNAVGPQTGLAVGSGLAGATGYLIAGGYTSAFGGIWYGGLTPSTSNYSLVASNTQTVLNAATTVGLTISNSANIVNVTSSLVSITQPVFLTGKITTYNNIATAGIGVPTVYAAANITAQSAAATITSYTASASDGDYEVSASCNITVATAISTSLNVTYTDVNNVAQTLILPVQKTGATGGTYLTNGLIIATGDYTTPVHKIRVKASTVITVLTATGTFTGVTYSASGNIKQTA